MHIHLRKYSLPLAYTVLLMHHQQLFTCKSLHNSTIVILKYQIKKEMTQSVVSHGPHSFSRSGGCQNQ